MTDEDAVLTDLRTAIHALCIAFQKNGIDRPISIGVTHNARRAIMSFRGGCSYMEFVQPSGRAQVSINGVKIEDVLHD